MRHVEQCSTCGLPHASGRGRGSHRAKDDDGCVLCGLPRAAGHAYCVECKAAYARGHRRRHRELNFEQRRKANARAYLNVYVRRGKIERPDHCEMCGNGSPQAHHDDYDLPLDVRWLCRRCHRLLHRMRA